MNRGTQVNPHRDAVYRYFGTAEEGEAEYKRFQGCLLQLVDENSIVGDLQDQWVIFKNGWVYGLSAFGTEENAIAFANQIFRDEPDANFIIAQVLPETHALTAMHLIGSALSDVESYQMKQRQAEEAADEGASD